MNHIEMDWDYLEKEKIRIQESQQTGLQPHEQIPIRPQPIRPQPIRPILRKPVQRKRKQNPCTPVMSPASTVSAPYRASPELPNHKGLHLTIDVRESTIYSICQDICQIQNLTDAFCPRLVTKSLFLGDMEIHTSQGVPVVLFERKTISDLLASIKDGRYAEQSYRLTNACSLSPHNIVYIIEGPIRSKQSNSTMKQIQSALVSLQFFKGFSVVRTNSARETAEYIMETASRLAAKLKEGRPLYFSNKASNEEHGQGQEQGHQQDPPLPNYATVVKSCKKQNVTYQNIHTIMLSQIPGISPQIAEIILEGQTLEYMIDRLRKGDRWLFSIKIASSATSKPRQMSKSIIKSIYLYFFNTDPPIN